MNIAVAILLIAAVVMLVLRAFGVGLGRVDLGWLAAACVVTALWALPAIQLA